MSPRAQSLLQRMENWLGEEDDPKEPFYDPVHLAGSAVVTLVVIGCLYWLLWTLLVFEGGLFAKVSALASVLLTSKTLSDYGYHGSPHAMGLFEGWLGNTAALLLCVAVIVALYKAYRDAAKKSRRKK